MLSSFLSFCLRFFRSRIQLQLEIIFLRKQLDILARTSTRPRLLPSDRIFFSVMTDAFSSWKETLLVLRSDPVIRWHRQRFRLLWKWKSRSEAGRPKIPEGPNRSDQADGKRAPLWAAPGFTESCSSSGLLSQKPQYNDTCPRDSIERHGNVGKPS